MDIDLSSILRSKDAKKNVSLYLADGTDRYDQECIAVLVNDPDFMGWGMSLEWDILTRALKNNSDIFEKGLSYYDADIVKSIKSGVSMGWLKSVDMSTLRVVKIERHIVAVDTVLSDEKVDLS